MRTLKHEFVGCLATALLGVTLAGCGGADDTVSSAVGKSVDKAGVAAAQSLSVNKAPGANVDLTQFSLQLPTGASGKVDTISGATLAAGFTSPSYFYTDPVDGSMVMMDPTQGWATSGSEHPRVELREVPIWPTTGVNKLNATVAVTQVPGHTTVGQIFQGTGPSKPLCELQVTSTGAVQLLLERTNQGGSADTYTIATVPVGTRFDYELSLSGSTITVTVGTTVKTYTMDSSFVGESFYFKAGNYDQTARTGTPLTTPGTVVKFYALKRTHK
jgi:hypothetical protein